jgi:Ser/Thr protein kinase RdoA (MazF antagonist)
VAAGDGIDLSVGLRAWGIAEPITVERLGGSNNTSWRLGTASGEYVLRLYGNLGNLPHVRFEHAVLRQLGRIPLSFEVPVPLPSVDGDTLVPVELGGERQFASLFALIPGEHPRDWSNRARLGAAGAALGELDRALAALRSMEEASLPLYRDLDRIHSAVPDPESAVAALPIDPAQADAFVASLGRARESVDRLYEALPHQVIHSDIDGSNMLYTGDRVSGILDFEFASFDLRAMDLTVAVVQMAGDGDGLDMDRVRVLAGAYRTEMALLPAEIAAVPDLIRLRGAVTVIHRLGRWRVGLSPLGAVEGRIRHQLAMEEWLDRNGGTLVATVSSSEAIAEGGHGGTEDVVLDEQPEEAPEGQ